MSKNKNYRDNKISKKAFKLSKKIDDTDLNRALASKEMADPVKTITEHTHGKRFKFRGIDGGLKKMLKTGCIHHYYSKKGNLKPAVIVNDNSTEAYCPICGRTIPLEAFSAEEFDKVWDTVTKVSDQVNFLAGRLELGKPAYRYGSAMMVRNKKWMKYGRKVLELTRKEDVVNGGKHKGKNKNHGGNGGSNIAGGWY